MVHVIRVHGLAVARKRQPRDQDLTRSPNLAGGGPGSRSSRADTSCLLVEDTSTDGEWYFVVPGCRNRRVRSGETPLTSWAYRWDDAVVHATVQLAVAPKAARGQMNRFPDFGHEPGCRWGFHPVIQMHQVKPHPHRHAARADRAIILSPVDKGAFLLLIGSRPFVARSRSSIGKPVL